jgi:hypothetical protein
MLITFDLDSRELLFDANDSGIPAQNFFPGRLGQCCAMQSEGLVSNGMSVITFDTSCQ